MSNNQPEALRLAEVFGSGHYDNGTTILAASELRRLHALNGELLEALHALTDFPADTFEGDQEGYFTMTVLLSHLRAARTAIAKARGQQ